jgi:hypothetical protein
LVWCFLCLVRLTVRSSSSQDGNIGANPLRDGEIKMGNENFLLDFEVGDRVELTDTGRHIYGGNISEVSDLEIISINKYVICCKSSVSDIIINISSRYLQLKKNKKEKMLYYCKACILETLCREKKISIFHITGTQFFQNQYPYACEINRQQKAIKKISETYFKKDKKANGIITEQNEILKEIEQEFFQ